MKKQARWLIIDPDNIITNIVLWNGDKTQWSPPEGHRAIRASYHPDANIGDELPQHG